MTDQPTDPGDLTPAEAGIWPQGFDPEDAPAPLTTDEAAQLARDAEEDPAADYDVTGGQA